MAELHGDLFICHASPSEVYVLVVVDERSEHAMSVEPCPSRFVVDATENSKEAWRPKCVAPRLVYDSAFFFETSMHVYVRTIITTTYVQRKKKEAPSEVRSRDEHVPV